ncbi:hypothetical protein CC80DRAFT_551590 [Byssothecium circinans]|uniref:Uncharacterized protein n=1 Tax=Byssothecium circinans TaxID=147558 RepID=A0A6A5TLY5_9PLEO|nr:hypothetical protein CC80DRAFT_551590 [Byssothecium circinans]
MKHITSDSQWTLRSGIQQCDAPTAIPIEYAPDWMRGIDSLADDMAEMPDEFSAAQHPAAADEWRRIQVVWKHASRHKKNAVYVQELEEQDVFDDAPKNVTITIKNRNVFGPQVRDSIREAFKLHEDDGELQQLTLHAEQEQDKSYPAQDPSLSFTCLFRQRDSNEMPWEYGGPPAVLLNYLEAKEGGVVSEMRQIFQMTVPLLETRLEPLDLFANDKKRMFKFYDGHDVSTPQGRRDWQLRVLRITRRHWQSTVC